MPTSDPFLCKTYGISYDTVKYCKHICLSSTSMNEDQSTTQLTCAWCGEDLPKLYNYLRRRIHGRCWPQWFIHHEHEYGWSFRCAVDVCDRYSRHKGMTRCYYGHLLIYKQWKDISWPEHLFGCGWVDPNADETPLDKYLFDLARLRKFGDA